MAGDWIKMTCALWNDGTVVRTAARLNVRRAEVIGALFRLWSLADEQTTDGKLTGYDAAAVDAEVGLPGFAGMLEEYGWLRCDSGKVEIPKFARHNGQSAKRRAMERNRKQKERQKPVRKPSASGADKLRPREENSTEEQRTEEGEVFGLDGAIDSLSKKQANSTANDPARVDSIRNAAYRIKKHGIPVSKPADRRFVLQVATALVDKDLAENDVWESLESLSAKRAKGEGINSPVAWFRRSLANQRFGKRPEGDRLPALAGVLNAASIPSELIERPPGNDASGRGERMAS